MKIVVINNGVVHAKSRTLSFCQYFDEVHYIDMAGVDKTDDFIGTNIIYHSPFPGKKNLWSDFKMIRLLNEIKPDGIISHFASGPGYFNSISYGKCPVSVIAMGHDVLYDKGDGYTPKYWKFLIRYALRNTDFISAKSNILKERILSYGVKSKIDVNYWGADFNTFKPIDKENAKKLLELTQIKSILLSPRAIEPRLNILLIVDAFKEIKNKFPDLTLILVGRALDSYKQEVIKFINANDLGKRVLIYDQCDSETLNLFYNAADVVVSIASSEGFPNSVLEAMACQKPIIVGEIEQIKELLNDNTNSFISKINKVGLINTYLKVMNLEDVTKKEIVLRAKETVNTFGDISKNGRIFAESFIKVINENNDEPYSLKIFKKLRKNIFEAVYIFIILVKKIQYIRDL